MNSKGYWVDKIFNSDSSSDLFKAETIDLNRLRIFSKAVTGSNSLLLL